MSIPVDGSELSISQHLRAAKRKLQGATFGGRVVTALNNTEVNALERDASQVLSLVRSMKNGFALVNMIPPDVLSLIPNYWEDSDRDECLIKLTHVCRGWREFFTSRPSLWTHLDCVSVEKTKVYIERSKTFPLEISLAQTDNTFNWEEAFVLTRSAHRSTQNPGRLRKPS